MVDKHRLGLLVQFLLRLPRSEMSSLKLGLQSKSSVPTFESHLVSFLVSIDNQLQLFSARFSESRPFSHSIFDASPFFVPLAHLKRRVEVSVGF